MPHKLRQALDTAEHEVGGWVSKTLGAENGLARWLRLFCLLNVDANLPLSLPPRVAFMWEPAKDIPLDPRGTCGPVDVWFAHVGPCCVNAEGFRECSQSPANVQAVNNLHYLNKVRLHSHKYIGMLFTRHIGLSFETCAHTYILFAKLGGLNAGYAISPTVLGAFQGFRALYLFFQGQDLELTALQPHAQRLNSLSHTPRPDQTGILLYRICGISHLKTPCR